MKGPIFQSTQNSFTRLNERSLRRRIEFYLVASGLKRKKLASHSLRKSSVTFALEAGADVFEIMNHLDHANLSVSAKYIGRLSQNKHKTSERINIKF